MAETIAEKRKSLLELTNRWFEHVGKDHHKDRDCHWRIEETWSYGKKPVYIVSHYGYVFKEVYEEYPTYEKAIDGLINLIITAFEEEKEGKDLNATT